MTNPIKITYPAALGGMFIETIYTPTNGAIQDVVDAAHDQGRQVERTQVINLLSNMDAPLEIIMAVTNGDTSPNSIWQQGYSQGFKDGAASNG